MAYWVMFSLQSIAQNADLNFLTEIGNKTKLLKMVLLMSTPNMGIITLLMLAVMIFFQVIIHNGQETKRYNKIVEQLKRLEEKLEKLRQKE